LSPYGERVSFKWKDYWAKANARYKLMTLDADEFIRRFLIHVLPDGLHRIRHYGLFADGNRAANITLGPAGCSAHPTHRRRAGRATAPKIVTTTTSGTLAVAAAGV
jgi:hypothetical protein